MEGRETDRQADSLTESRRGLWGPALFSQHQGHAISHLVPPM
jgi:hypothetical protein